MCIYYAPALRREHPRRMGQYIRHDENANVWEYNSDGQDENHAGREQ